MNEQTPLMSNRGYYYFILSAFVVVFAGIKQTFDVMLLDVVAAVGLYWHLNFRLILLVIF